MAYAKVGYSNLSHKCGSCSESIQSGDSIVFYNNGSERFHLRCFPYAASIQYLTTEALQGVDQYAVDKKFGIVNYFASDGRGYAQTKRGHYMNITIKT
mmetsp:Transcript_36629/g.44316  ORF Transcript_36629/g.44316 Transcript_36629/m.44316 type:complete len:98 (+) Transcript_36629:1-294(+)